MPGPSNRLANMNKLSDKPEQKVDNINETTVREIHNFWKEMSKKSNEEEGKYPNRIIPRKERVRYLERQIHTCTVKSPQKCPIPRMNDKNISFIRYLWEDVPDINMEFRDDSSMHYSIEHEIECPLKRKSNDKCDSDSDTHENHLGIDTSYINSMKKMWQQRENSNCFPVTRETTHEVHTKLVTRATREIAAENTPHDENNSHFGELPSRINHIENTHGVGAVACPWEGDDRHFRCFSVDPRATEKLEKHHSAEVDNTKNVLDKKCMLETTSKNKYDSESGTEEMRFDFNSTKSMWQQRSDGNHFTGQTQYTRQKKEVARNNKSQEEHNVHSGETSSRNKCSEDMNRTDAVEHLRNSVVENMEFGDGIFGYQKEWAAKTKSGNKCESQPGTPEYSLDIDTSHINTIKKMWQRRDKGEPFPVIHETADNAGTREKEVATENRSHEEDNGHSSDSSFRAEHIDDKCVIAECVRPWENKNGCFDYEKEFAVETKTSDKCDFSSSTREPLNDVETSSHGNSIKYIWQQTDSGSHIPVYQGTIHEPSPKQYTIDMEVVDADNHFQEEDNGPLRKSSPMPVKCGDDATGTTAVEWKFSLPDDERPKRSTKQLIEERFNENRGQISKGLNPSFIPQTECHLPCFKQIAGSVYTQPDLVENRPHNDPRDSERKWRSLCRNILGSKGLKYFTLGSITVAGVALFGATVNPDLVFGPTPPPPPTECSRCIEILESMKRALQYTPLSRI